MTSAESFFPQGGIVISQVATGGAAEKDGRIKVGDQILGVG